MKTISVITLTISFLSSAGLSMPVAAQSVPASTNTQTAAQVARNADDMTDGEVKKIDKDTGKITLKHGNIKSLDMPSMTMVFNVQDKSLLEKIKVGEKIKFRAISDHGKLVVTDLNPTQ